MLSLLLLLLLLNPLVLWSVMCSSGLILRKFRRWKSLQGMCKRRDTKNQNSSWWSLGGCGRDGGPGDPGSPGGVTILVVAVVVVIDHCLGTYRWHSSNHKFCRLKGKPWLQGFHQALNSAARYFWHDVDDISGIFTGLSEHLLPPDSARCF